MLQTKSFYLMTAEIFKPGQNSQENKEIPRKLRIGVDLDGTLVASEDWYLRLIRRGLGIRLDKKQMPEYHFERLPEIINHPRGLVFLEALLKSHLPEQLAKPSPGAVEVIQRWYGQGHELWFITARPLVFEVVTKQWFKRYGLSLAKDRIYFFQPADTSRATYKDRIVKELDLHVFIDDHALTARTVESPSLALVLVFRYGWNCAEEIGPNSRFVDSWAEIAQLVQKLCKD